MSAIDGSYTTWNNARETFGQGNPQAGTDFDNSAQLSGLGSGLSAAAPGSKWSGGAATNYDKANTEHQQVFNKLAALDQKVAQQVDNSAQVVATGRQNLDSVKQWVTDAVNSLPPGKQRDMMELQIANRGLGQLTEVVEQTNKQSNAIGQNIGNITKEFQEVKGTIRFASETKDRDGEPEALGATEEEDGDKKDEEEKPGSGAADGEALAEQAALPPAQRDPAVLDRVADNLPQTSLTADQVKALAEGREVHFVPKETLDYYRDFYNGSGKDGLLLLDRHLEAQEAAGDADAGGQRDRLANGLTMTSNENVVELNPDGTVASRGGYDQLPPDLQEMLEVRRSDATYPGWETLGPTDAKNQHVADVVQFSELMGEANPGFQPGSRLGTEMYLKSADMVGNSAGGWGMTDTPPEAYERAANTLSEVAGRNNDASAQIFTGTGEDLPDGYNRDETVRTLIGHDWSQSGGEGNGAATLLDWMTEDSQRPIGDPIGDRARLALTEVPDLLAPSDTDPVYQNMRDSFARNDAISTEMGELLAANTEALVAPGQPSGFAETKLDSSGHPLLAADDANRLMQLGSYSDAGRVAMTTDAELTRINELKAAMQANSGNLSDQVANSAAGGLSGRLDEAMLNAVEHKNQLLQGEARDPGDALYQAKSAGAFLAGQVSEELVNKIPGSGRVTDLGDIDTSEMVENKIRDFLGTPEYQEATVPNTAVLEAKASIQAQQAVLQAAYSAGELPPELFVNGEVVEVADLAPSSAEYQRVQQYMIERGLTQYVTDYGQTYSNKLGGE